MYNKIISCFLMLLIFVLQVGCATFDNIPKEELANYYTDKGRYPSIIIKSLQTSYKIPHDTYYIDSDTIYFDLSVAEILWAEKYTIADKMAVQDIKIVEVAATNPLLGIYVWIVGGTLLGVAIWSIYGGDDQWPWF